MVKFETLLRSDEIKAVLITAEYNDAYAEKDFVAYPSISFPLISCFEYKAGDTIFLLDTNHILFEKGETAFTVSKNATFKKDVTLSIHFMKPIGEIFYFLNKKKQQVAIQKRWPQIEVLLRKFIAIAFNNDAILKEQILLDIVNTIAGTELHIASVNNSPINCVKKIDQSKDIKHTYYHDDLRIADIASAANLSSYHFSRLFRQATGYSPYGYLMSIRIENAKSLLHAGSSATNAAFSTGFNSLENFSFSFSRIVGCPPSLFKKSRISKVY